MAKLDNQVKHVPEKTDMRARASLSNAYLTQAPKPKSVGFLPMVLGVIFSGTKVGDGTLKKGTVEKAKAVDALKAKRRK